MPGRNAQITIDKTLPLGHSIGLMKTVKKAIIPTAGLGTRFLPATKSIPKELFPLVDKPLLLYIVEEAVAAGIEDIVLITGRGKSAIEDFFDCSYEVEDTLAKAGKTDLLSKISYIKNMANIISIRQKEPKGLGHAVLCGEHVIGSEPFAVLLGDEIMVGQPNVTEELCKHYQTGEGSVVAVMEVPRSEVSKYGIVKAKPLQSKLSIEHVVEKPSVEEAPSNWALPGRYVFENKLFGFLKETRPGKNGEIQLTDGMNGLAAQKRLWGATFSAKRYDAGDKFGFIQANIEIGLEHPETGDRLKTYLLDLAKRLD